MKLDALIAGIGRRVDGGGAVEVTGLTDDSREVRAGDGFIARGRHGGDGAEYVAQAVERGAVAVIAGADEPIASAVEARVAIVRVDGAVDQAVAGRIAERFFGRPGENLRLIGVTGTNGKTTVAFLIQHLLNGAGFKCGMMGTVLTDDGAAREQAALTTPGAVELSRRLAAMVGNGCDAAVLEVSSHALDQGRVGALGFEAAVFTNLTGDHLDYHQTMDRYAAAKARLFERLNGGGRAILNAEDPLVGRMLRNVERNVTWCRVADGPRCDGEGDHCVATVLDAGEDHTVIRLDGPWGGIESRLPWVGRHNVMNALQGVAVAHGLGVDAGALKRGLASCPAVPGRLERVRATGGEAGGPVVMVDYAHTHDALENVLRALRPTVRGRLIVVFGCGGDRDRSKRARMGEVACRLADGVVVTSDNPRTEDPGAIIEDILAGVPEAERGGQGDKVTVEADRAAAIEGVVAAAWAGDVVLLAGKGHEDYQIVGSERRHFDDREQGRAALDRWLARQG